MYRLLGQLISWWNRDLYSQKLELGAIIASYIDESQTTVEEVRRFFGTGMFSNEFEDLLKQAIAQVEGAEQDLRREGIDPTKTAIKRLLIERLSKALEYDVEGWIQNPF